MKLLYLSCHSILEHDEIKLFDALGIEVFSFGTYKNPQKIDDLKRPILDIKRHPELEALCEGADQSNIPQKLIDWADVIVCMHKPEWLVYNWAKFTGKRVIFRSIGQCSIDDENMLRPLSLEGLEIVRYSPKEATILGYAGATKIIRFYKEPAEFGAWTGKDQNVLNITQDMIVRAGACNYNFWDQATTGFPRVLIGKGSEAIGKDGKGIVSYEEMKRALRDCGAYIYTGTYPASYTLNFIEALMTGCPIVAPGPKYGNDPSGVGFDTYEIPEFAKQSNGIIASDDINEIRKVIKTILEDNPTAQAMSAENRKLAVKLFGYETIKREWSDYLLD